MYKLNQSEILSDEELDGINLIDRLLKDQRELTAVEKFSQVHEKAADPLQQPHYEDLIPIRKPSSGEQYSFSVDLDKCTGCKACVVACHSRNGLDANESWRDVGKITSMATQEQQTVTTACHHCADPACMNGCPVGAYEKMPDTGIVRHLDDQCIGCEYCSLKCPYDVPKYNKDLGIVRKCDMCHDRLEEGEAPACVQSCPNGAIKIKLIKTDDIFKNAAKDGKMIAGAFRSDYTLPSTTYTSKRTLPSDMKAVDDQSITASHKHTPLSWMLMLTQVAVGISVVDLLARVIAPEWSAGMHVILLACALILGGVGLCASFLHLGSPFGAWRVFLGLKKSWLSREILMFGAWKPALATYLGLSVLESGLIPAKFIPDFANNLINQYLTPEIVTLSGVGAVIAGLLSVFCSIMVYVDTKRAFWSMNKTSGRFLGTSLWGGGLALLVTSYIVYGTAPAAVWAIAAATFAFKLIVEGVSLLPAREKEWSMAKKSALIQLKTLRSTFTLRWVSMGAVLLFSSLMIFQPMFGILALLSLLLGEWLERQLYFQAVVTLKMPGDISA
ncbi:dimethyl sulfoxide reductase anchor subunit [Akkermansiaceae bacterium]|nr:dimethyl sulfoxide reductase anchor subunit [Akkermansiaceae bacterium]